MKSQPRSSRSAGVSSTSSATSHATANTPVNTHAQEKPHQDWGYFARIPRILRTGTQYKSLTLAERWLYVCLKDLCGENGMCFRTLDTLSAETDFSTGSLSTMIRHLHEVGLIHATKKYRHDRGHKVWHISIVDIWGANATHCSKSEGSAENTVQNLKDSVQNLKDHDADPSNFEQDPSNFRDRRTNNEERIPSEERTMKNDPSLSLANTNTQPKTKSSKEREREKRKSSPAPSSSPSPVSPSPAAPSQQFPIATDTREDQSAITQSMPALPVSVTGVAAAATAASIVEMGYTKDMSGGRKEAEGEEAGQDDGLFHSVQGCILWFNQHQGYVLPDDDRHAVRRAANNLMSHYSPLDIICTFLYMRYGDPYWTQQPDGSVNIISVASRIFVKQREARMRQGWESFVPAEYQHYFQSMQAADCRFTSSSPADEETPALELEPVPAAADTETPSPFSSETATIPTFYELVAATLISPADRAQHLRQYGCPPTCTRCHRTDAEQVIYRNKWSWCTQCRLACELLNAGLLGQFTAYQQDIGPGERNWYVAATQLDLETIVRIMGELEEAYHQHVGLPLYDTVSS
jgi:hypothetical protein